MGGEQSWRAATMMGRTLYAAIVALSTARSVAESPVGAGIKRCLQDKVTMGVDYYPEQWPFEDMKGDMAAIKDDLGADIIRIGEFMWHELEPTDGVFNFTLMDTILQNAEDVGLEVMLGTPTATFPAWLYKKHPDIVFQGPDSSDGYAAAKPGFGGRRQYSFNSKTYLQYVRRLVAALAERYGQRRTVSVWQVDNELGHEGSDLDFSDNSLYAWREWLNRTYHGDIASLNSAWGTTFWGATYNSFDEVPLPHYTVPGEKPRESEVWRSNSHPGELLDFRRFRRDSIASFAGEQVAILRAKNVSGCVTTNAEGGFWAKAIDFNDIFATMDFPSYDNYPVWGGSVEPTPPSKVALYLDIVRGWALGMNRSGWMVAEQLIGAQGHDVIGYTPRPGQVAGWAAASLLHGARSISFFRYRAAVYGQEQFCYGILDHSTPRGTGRKWKEVKDVYKLARDHERLWLAPVEAQVGYLYSDENIFAWQAQPQSTVFDFENEAHRLFYPFWRNGATVDVISSRHLLKGRTIEQALAALAHYRVLVLPAPMLTSDSLVLLLEKFVQRGGSLWMGYRSDLKDERSQVRRVPSRLAALAGAEIAEIESLNGDASHPITVMVNSTGLLEGAPPASPAFVWREGLTLREGSGAEALWKYTDDFFGALGYAAATRLRSASNNSEAIYIGTGIDQEALISLASSTLRRQGVPMAGIGKTANVEQALRKDLDGKLVRVSINHGMEAVGLDDSTQLQPFEIHIAEFSPGTDHSAVAAALDGAVSLAEEADATLSNSQMHRWWGPWTEACLAGVFGTVAFSAAWMRGRREGRWTSIVGAKPELLL